MATKSRGLLLALVVAVAGGVGAWWWTGRGPVDRDTAAAAPARGGELVVTLRNEPARYNRFLDNSTAAEVLGLLTHGRLVRVNRATDELEPALAESWTQSDDGLTYTLKLRSGVRFSDGAPFTADDVLFTFRVLYDATVNSSIAQAMRPGGKPLEVSAPDPSTIVIRLPSRFAPGVRMLDYMPILPRHRLEAALNEGRFRDVWKVGTPLTDIAGLGPFVLTEHVAGQRLVLARNPHYWLKDARGVQLPYVDTITILLIPDQNTEALRVEAGDVDVMSNGDIRPEDYAAFKRAADQGRLRLIDGGLGLDPNLLWFNLRPTRKGKPWFDRREFRQAISYAVDRQVIVNTVFLGEAVPVYGPISPGNRTWYSDSLPKYEHNPAKARELLSSIGLRDGNGDGTLEDASGAPVRFSILTQRGHTIRERTVSVIQEQLRQVGIQIDVVGVDTPSLHQRHGSGDHDAVYYGFQSSSTDPALNPELWFSSGFFHVWNPQQATPATPWERRVDELMHQQTASMDPAERVRIMVEVQRIIGEEMPAVWFAVPKNILAVSRRLVNATPARQAPHLLWRAETLAVTGDRRGS